MTSTESSTGASTGVLHPKVLDKRWARQLRLFAKQRNDGRAVLRVAGILEAVVVVLLLQVVAVVAFSEVVEETGSHFSLQGRGFFGFFHADDSL